MSDTAALRIVATISTHSERSLIFLVAQDESRMLRVKSYEVGNTSLKKRPFELRVIALLLGILGDWGPGAPTVRQVACVDPALKDWFELWAGGGAEDRKRMIARLGDSLDVNLIELANRFEASPDRGQCTLLPTAQVDPSGRLTILVRALSRSMTATVPSAYAALVDAVVRATPSGAPVLNILDFDPGITDGHVAPVATPPIPGRTVSPFFLPWTRTHRLGEIVVAVGVDADSDVDRGVDCAQSVVSVVALAPSGAVQHLEFPVVADDPECLEVFGVLVAASVDLGPGWAGYSRRILASESVECVLDSLTGSTPEAADARSALLSTVGLANGLEWLDVSLDGRGGKWVLEAARDGLGQQLVMAAKEVAVDRRGKEGTPSSASVSRLVQARLPGCAVSPVHHPFPWAPQGVLRELEPQRVPVELEPEKGEVSPIFLPLAEDAGEESVVMVTSACVDPGGSALTVLMVYPDGRARQLTRTSPISLDATSIETVAALLALSVNLGPMDGAPRVVYTANPDVVRRVDELRLDTAHETNAWDFVRDSLWPDDDLDMHLVDHALSHLGSRHRVELAPGRASEDKPVSLLRIDCANIARHSRARLAGLNAAELDGVPRQFLIDVSIPARMPTHPWSLFCGVPVVVGEGLCTTREIEAVNAARAEKRANQEKELASPLVVESAPTPVRREPSIELPNGAMRVVTQFNTLPVADGTRVVFAAVGELNGMTYLRAWQVFYADDATGESTLPDVAHLQKVAAMLGSGAGLGTKSTARAPRFVAALSPAALKWVSNLADMAKTTRSRTLAGLRKDVGNPGFVLTTATDRLVTKRSTVVSAAPIDPDGNLKGLATALVHALAHPESPEASNVVHAMIARANGRVWIEEAMERTEPVGDDRTWAPASCHVAITFPRDRVVIATDASATVVNTNGGASGLAIIALLPNGEVRHLIHHVPWSIPSSTLETLAVLTAACAPLGGEWDLMPRVIYTDSQATMDWVTTFRSASKRSRKIALGKIAAHLDAPVENLDWMASVIERHGDASWSMVKVKAHTASMDAASRANRACDQMAKMARGNVTGNVCADVAKIISENFGFAYSSTTQLDSGMLGSVWGPVASPAPNIIALPKVSTESFLAAWLAIHRLAPWLDKELAAIVMAGMSDGQLLIIHLTEGRASVESSVAWAARCVTNERAVMMDGMTVPI